MRENSESNAVGPSIRVELGRRESLMDERIPLKKVELSELAISSTIACTYGGN